MVQEVLREIVKMGVFVKENGGTRGDCLELTYGNTKSVVNLNGYRELYQLKLILNTDVMSKVFR
jgi:hypothetical protein